MRGEYPYDVSVRRTHAIALIALLGACGGRSLPDDKKPVGATDLDAGTRGSGGGPLAKVDEIDLVLEGSEVSISVTDETGSVELQKVDSFLGACEKLAAPEDALWLVDCLADGTGLRLKFVHRRSNLIVLRAKVTPSNPSPGFDEYEVLKELPLPQGGQLRLNP